MNRFLLLLGFMYFTCASGFAQEPPLNSGMVLGFQLNQHQNDFGLGINVSSPYFFGDRLAFRLNGNLKWNQHLLDGETTWTPYSNISLGVVGVGGYIGDRIRLYGEGGVIALFPSSDFSEESSHVGGYGLFGFEFFMDSRRNYFIELGGMGVGASADLVPGDPIYSNGFMINVGYRYQFN